MHNFLSHEYDTEYIYFSREKIATNLKFYDSNYTKTLLYMRVLYYKHFIFKKLIPVIVHFSCLYTEYYNVERLSCAISFAYYNYVLLRNVLGAAFSFDN